MKKPSKKTLNRLALERWSVIVKTKACFKCEICGKQDGLQSHHVVSRHLLKTRFDTKNGVCLCSNHHMMSKYNSAHKGGLGFWIFFISHRFLDFVYLAEIYKKEIC